jgi:hypothetical protein
MFISIVLINDNHYASLVINLLNHRVYIKEGLELLPIDGKEMIYKVSLRSFNSCSELSGGSPVAMLLMKSEIRVL